MPRAWRPDSLSCSRLPALAAAPGTAHAHFRVSTSSPVFGAKPWAVQAAGCGRQGEYVQAGGRSSGFANDFVNDFVNNFGRGSNGNAGSGYAY